MTIKGCDTTDHTLTGATLKANGLAFVCRYVLNALTGTLDKELRATELPEKKAAGVRIVSNWEWAAAPANFRSTGKDHATRCKARLASLGAPDWAPVYYSIDTPAVAGSYNAYAQGWRDVYPAEQLGVYGDGALFRQLKADGYVTLAWQSMSKSFPGNHHPDGTWNHDGADIIQTGGGSVAGHSVDFNTAVIDNYGGWLQGEEDPNMAVTAAEIAAIANAVWNEKLGSSGPTAAIALQSTYNNVIKLLGEIPTSGGALTDADKDDIAKRVADLLAARLVS